MTADLTASYAGKVAFVTGATSGIGRATALAFARAGANVVVADVSDQGKRKPPAMITEIGGQCAAVRCDVTLARRCESRFGPDDRCVRTPDFAFNNAGVDSRSRRQRT